VHGRKPICAPPGHPRIARCSRRPSRLWTSSYNRPDAISSRARELDSFCWPRRAPCAMRPAGGPARGRAGAGPALGYSARSILRWRPRSTSPSRRQPDGRAGPVGTAGLSAGRRGHARRRGVPRRGGQRRHVRRYHAGGLRRVEPLLGGSTKILVLALGAN
jgi:hypothetical protein